MASLKRGKAAVIVMGMGNTWHNLRKRDWSHGEKVFQWYGWLLLQIIKR